MKWMRFIVSVGEADEMKPNQHSRYILSHRTFGRDETAFSKDRFRSSSMWVLVCVCVHRKEMAYLTILGGQGDILANLNACDTTIDNNGPSQCDTFEWNINRTRKQRNQREPWLMHILAVIWSRRSIKVHSVISRRIIYFIIFESAKTSLEIEIRHPMIQHNNKEIYSKINKTHRRKAKRNIKKGT